MLPKFESPVEDIDTQSDACRVFTAFIEHFRREELFDAAEAYVRQQMPNGSIYTFRHMDGGLMRFVCGLIVMGSTGGGKPEPMCWVDEKICDHYGFTQESIPPRMILREACATRIRLDTLLADLAREMPHHNVDWANRVKAAANGLERVEDAHLLSNERADEILGQ